ncbi:MAG: hypothetical protein KC613_07535 [Myxococcales bacterium]|nr:hypothetical protein [Myxococcales bacterium]MCB9523190.1 hypothetical protein [Myxococcales bacterium]
MPRRAFALACLLALTGCDELLQALGGDQYLGGPPVDAEVGPADVAGEWQLTGSGRMFDCSDDAYETDALRIDAAPLRVAQDGAALTVPNPPAVPGGAFAFRDGLVTGSRVRFVTEEVLPDGDKLTLEFQGVLDSLGRVAGTFEGSGPRSCASEGRFSVEIR